MAGPQNDTSEIRAWLATQLKLEDVPETIWELLVEDEYVEGAQYHVFPDARDELVRQARKLLSAYRAGAGAGPAPKKQPTGKRRKATAVSRSKVVAEIKAKSSQAKENKDPDASPNGGEEELEALTPEQRELLARERAFAESPLTGEISNNLITVTAEPSVSPEDVRRQYESLRRAWFYTETPSERRVELVNFVTSFCEGYYNEERGRSGLLRGPDWPGWRQIMAQWNQRYPQGHDWYYTDVRNFSRVFRETFEALTLFENF
jgi:hypothetical protein